MVLNVDLTRDVLECQQGLDSGGEAWIEFGESGIVMVQCRRGRTSFHPLQIVRIYHEVLHVFDAMARRAEVDGDLFAGLPGVRVGIRKFGEGWRGNGEHGGGWE
jgi:hypothetical protein